VPTPETDLESDLWFAHQVLVGENTFASGIGFDDHAAMIHRKINFGALGKNRTSGLIFDLLNQNFCVMQPKQFQFLYSL